MNFKSTITFSNENTTHLTKFDYTHMNGIKQFIKKCIEQFYFRQSLSVHDNKVPSKLDNWLLVKYGFLSHETSVEQDIDF